ncbi:MAG TPA: alpha/beta fold hydrolase [Actinomycetota bacterium]|nr:alpha/beta fold hydrolase [Actinomycetota bacterium]
MRAAVRIGIIAGVVTTFLAAVGLIGNFTDLNLIGEEVTFAQLMLVLPPLVAGYVATLPKVEAGEVVELARSGAAMTGAATGAISGVVFGVFTVFVDTFGVERVRAIVGASYGGMVALAFAERFAERVEQLVVISAAHESHPMSTGLRSLQRRVVELGLEHGFATEALEVARGIAMTTYRTAREFAERFDNTPTVLGETEVSFEVERYLANRGARFAVRFSPEYFLALSLSSDLHRVDPSAVHAPTTLVAAEGDALVPEEQIRTLARRLAVPSRLVHLPTIFGHDAFLKEPEQIGEILSVALSHRVSS